jgi:transcriptional regulator with XRE-family HTH domain
MQLRIREIRQERGFTQAQLGARAYISRSLLALIETGARPVNTQRLRSIAKALEVPVADLFGGEAQEAYRPVILDLMRRLSPEAREDVIRHAQALVSPQWGGLCPLEGRQEGGEVPKERATLRQACNAQKQA